MAGRKHDAGKPDWTLLPLAALAVVVAVLGFGASKYAPDGWRLVPDARRRYRAAAWRHLVASEVGEDLVADAESGLPHLAHAICNLLFVLALSLEARS